MHELELIGFEMLDAYDGYIDFERHPGEARTERITLTPDGNVFATIRDVDPSGLETLSIDIEEDREGLSIRDCLLWLQSNRDKISRDQEIIDALVNLRDAFRRVEALWDHTGTNMLPGYPPWMPSFDEATADVAAWADEFIAKAEGRE